MSIGGVITQTSDNGNDLQDKSIKVEVNLPVTPYG